MNALIWLAILVAVVAGAVLWPRWRLRRLLAQPLAPQLVALLEQQVPVVGRMSHDLQQQLQRLIQLFLHQKKFVGCAGLEIDDRVRITIAGQACLLLLNRPSRVFPLLHTILVYPSAFLVPRQLRDEAGVVTEGRQDLLGESWSDGRVILSWDHVQQGAHNWTDGQNVVLHEFAHQLDSESGSNNGAPYLGSQSSYRSWSAVLSRDYANLRADALYQQQSVMDHYGATSPAEFFAVATETYFEKPHQMAEAHPALFSEFFKYYRVDPRAWQRAPEVEEAPAHGANAFGQWQ